MRLPPYTYIHKHRCVHVHTDKKYVQMFEMVRVGTLLYRLLFSHMRDFGMLCSELCSS